MLKSELLLELNTQVKKIFIYFLCSYSYESKAQKCTTGIKFEDNVKNYQLAI